MDRLLSALLIGITSFISTNLDDLIISMIFFSQVSPTFRRHHIVLGKYLGFLVILLASLPGYLGGLAISKEWLGLLGFLPIGVGISQWLKGHPDEPAVQSVSDVLISQRKSSIFAGLTGLLEPPVYQVAAVTVANAGDNISIYVPLFANSSLPRLGLIVGIFLILVGVFCWVADKLTQHQAIVFILTHYGHQAVPFVLIGLGVYLLVDNGTLALLKTLLLNAGK